MILDGSRFYESHRVYLLATSVQLVAGLIHLLSVLGVWQWTDASGRRDDGLPNYGAVAPPRSD